MMHSMMKLMTSSLVTIKAMQLSPSELTLLTDDTTASYFLAGEWNSCPSSSTKVTDSASCQAAGSQLGLEYWGSGNWKDDLGPGCIAREGTSRGCGMNTGGHSSVSSISSGYATQRTDQWVCMSNPTPTPTPRPTPTPTPRPTPRPTPTPTPRPTPTPTPLPTPTPTTQEAKRKEMNEANRKKFEAKRKANEKERKQNGGNHKTEAERKASRKQLRQELGEDGGEADRERQRAGEEGDEEEEQEGDGEE